MAAAGGALEDDEKATVEAMFATLPEFKDRDFCGMLDRADKVYARSTASSSTRAPRGRPGSA